VLAEDGL